MHKLRAGTGQMLLLVVLELCCKTTLTSVARGGIFDVTGKFGARVACRALLRSATEIARGMLYLHDAGIVHGDLKPANVLLVRSDEDRRGFICKVADFGLSHVLPSCATSVTAESWGTVGYMSPEAFSGRSSRATDVWSFGVILCELMTGQPAYGDATREQVLAGVLAGSLHPAWPDGAPLIQPIIELGRRCLSRDPHDRPPFGDIMPELVRVEVELRAEGLAMLAEAQEAAEAAAALQAAAGPVTPGGGENGELETAACAARAAPHLPYLWL
ncbi:Mitogen-activated protein kinase kinase kinase 12 [Tetrabaena socialis]|uniref:Mitogen-activated protein kinase kinase kinase 12 n=1 Tax=Tetrabaena socialis TaxID=47790 RepID=A0A2J8AJG1_9CHLO|nr:Mitogen-activated protein kinase kinase kinase 12 [Tetrabaena socialis]|eukprot:PNH12643.1 Mitogen-activated protein kinase kinase kinase 12 [Tetrabaena socialis]